MNQIATQFGYFAKGRYFFFPQYVKKKKRKKKTLNAPQGNFKKNSWTFSQLKYGMKKKYCSLCILVY